MYLRFPGFEPVWEKITMKLMWRPSNFMIRQYPVAELAACHAERLL